MTALNQDLFYVSLRRNFCALFQKQFRNKTLALGNFKKLQPILMNNTKLTFILFFTVLSVRAQEANNIKTQQPILKNLFLWDNLVIAERDWVVTDKYYVCDALKGKLTRLQISNDTAILDLAETHSFVYAISKRDELYFLLKKVKGQNKWDATPLFPGFDKILKFKLVANDSMLVLITRDEIFYKQTNSYWQKTAIDSLMDEFNTYDYNIPKHCLMTANRLYLGYDNGEWGGALWEIPISNEGEKNLSKGKLILDDKIMGLQYSLQGTLWIASGLTQRARGESGIYMFEKDSLQQVLWPQPHKSRDRNQAESLPQQHLLFGDNSDLSAFCLKNKVMPFFILSGLGVFRIQKDGIEEVLKAKLNLEYSLGNDYSVGSRPVGMHIDNNNVIYIAQRSLGVFVYIKNKHVYSFRQISFD